VREPAVVAQGFATFQNAPGQKNRIDPERIHRLRALSKLLKDLVELTGIEPVTS